MGWTTGLITGLAELLATSGVGVWRPDGGYDAADVAIVAGPSLPQAPDQVICLTPYVLPGDLPGMTETTVGVQVRCRGTADPRVAEDLADAVRDQLHGLSGVDLGGVPVSQMWRQSGTPIGPDGNHRALRLDNYYVQANRASIHTTD